MIVRSVTHYLRRKKVLPTQQAGPEYEMHTLHSHSRPVSRPTLLQRVDSPGAKVVTL